MKSVHILGRFNGVDYEVLVQMLWQRQLYKDAMDLGIIVQTVNQRQQIGLGRVGIQLVFN